METGDAPLKSVIFFQFEMKLAFWAVFLKIINLFDHQKSWGRPLKFSDIFSALKAHISSKYPYQIRSVPKYTTSLLIDEYEICRRNTLALNCSQERPQLKDLSYLQDFVFSEGLTVVINFYYSLPRCAELWTGGAVYSKTTAMLRWFRLHGPRGRPKGKGDQESYP